MVVTRYRSLRNKPDSSRRDYHFWESEVELVRKKTIAPDGRRFRYFDDRGIFNFVFLVWMGKWARETSRRYMDPYMLHPLPLADQLLIWQPILSKHISDGIASLEMHSTFINDDKKPAEILRPVRYVLARAIWLTFWRRILFVLIAIVFMNGVGMSIAIFLHKLLGLLSGKDFRVATLIGFAVGIIFAELVKEMCMDHIEYYVSRLSFVMDGCLRVTIFQHGVCYRRSQFSNFKSKKLGQCNSIIHGCSGEHLCTQNPLLCPARRYKNNEVTPKMYALILNDPYYIPLFVECMTGLIDFLTAFTYGLILMGTQFNVKILTILLISLTLVVGMILVEIAGGFLMRYYLGIRDHRITKSFEVVSSLHLINKMSLDDMGHNAVTEARNDELRFVLIRFFLSLVNKVVITSIMCINIIFLINDFVAQVKRCPDIKSINPSGLLASIFVLMKILGPLYLVPLKLKLLVFTLTSFKRVEAFLETCSPNFYLPDNRYSGATAAAATAAAKAQNVPKDMVVMFKKASFSWIHSRRDLLEEGNIGIHLDRLDFVLNTGDLAIVTGAQGSGKTNFVKAILGDMTLVEGSMAVLPLSTNMPIFYASQDVWLQKGTIKSNITFGHRFDEDVYNTVIKAVELEHDISTWEEGDMRKISEHGYSLSGGQRVRVGLARAIYAYLIFSKANGEDNSSQCSFLVVLDDSFTGLDPFVAKTIFKNLFEKGRGLLSGGDVATVLTISKRILDACVSSESPDSYPDAPVYTLRNETLIQENRLKSLIENEVGRLDIAPLSDDRMGLHAMPSKLRRMCSSDEYTRFGRRSSVETKYSESPTVQNLYNRINFKRGRNDNFRAVNVYIRAAGWPIFFFFFFTLAFSTLDNTKFIIASKVSDSVVDYTKKHGAVDTTSFSDIKNYSVKALRRIVIISVSVMVGAILRILSMTKASVNVSRRVHEYCINSVFVNSSTVLKIKKSLGSVITFLYMDTFFIDNLLSYFIHDACLLLIESSVHLLTLFFMMPWSSPLALVLCFIIFRYIVCYYVKSCKNVYFARLETCNQIDSTIESAISGAQIYRSFKKEWELIHAMTEHADYNIRCSYVSKSAMTWSSIASRCLLSPLALFILLFPLIRSRYFGTKVNVGYYGMAFSIVLSLNSTFTIFLKLYCFLELYMGSIRRFEHFVPPNTPVKFDKKRDIHQTDLIVDRSGYEITDNTSDDVKGKLRKRRRKEYASRRAARCTGLRMLFFKHKINIFDVSDHMSHEEVRVKLDNVSVYIVSRISKEKHAILKNVTCSANTSDIIGIIGRTGAGKSTMLSVLQNLARNREGSVLLDGCDLNDLPKSVTRQVIGVLPQLPFVFRGWTVRRFIDPRMLFEDVDIEMALENCGLLKFVEGIEGGKGLDTVILPDHYHKDMPRYYKRVYYGPELKPQDTSSADNVNIDYGAVLSNSQLRTLSVARLVLYREFFKVLLIDEPPEDEHETSYTTVGIPIYELIKTHFQHCTTFIAAHDASVLRLCTSVWVFHSGSLIKTCKTEEVVDSGSLSKIIEDCIVQYAQPES
ncbi:ABC transporter, ATP-binding protein domain containing protein [Theileria equi strain WA]|uniref:ABC transporter, ATP-binding protein domain containing protein n=1 Tax=Theileria equi strain WA TaxID=1537102 RepID=L1L9N8_THEEQ|nr:ABC transporter, ATP-binding protein domain containing protein [Theileria equi strain WA]EKX72142.1 ABC transporter, ATP-binding protein domain containing protein [Theileria equi strain WA]|eukprot:XP_004831594.1 ABC transporter, ATP-binding protein domain containing protein [Theileria equi strain WA]